MAEKVEFYKEIEFKDTEIGKIPKEWEAKKLGDIGIFQYGVTTSAKDKDTGVKFLRITDIKKDGTIDWSTVPYCEINESELKKYKLNTGDVLFARIGATTGKTCFVDVPARAVAGSYLIKFEPFSDNIIYTKFLYYYAQSGIYWSQVNRIKEGRLKKGLNTELLKNLKLPFPYDLREQRKIAEILTTVDEAIQKTDDIIAKTESLKKGLMQELLTKGIEHKEFKFSKELDCEIPKEWSVVKLREIGENKDSIVAGPFGSNLKVKDYTTEGVPIIRLQNIERNKFIDENIKYTSPEKAKELSYHSFQPGDLVLAKLGDPIGKTCIIPSSIGRGIVVADVVRIRLSPKKVINKFIEYILNSNICYEQLRKEIIGTTRPRTNITQIRNLKLPLPSFQEQQKITSILSTVDEKLENLRREKTKLERIKQWFMEELLTGRLRVRIE